jgi:hypothetical protein
MVQHHKYSIAEIDGLLPYERDLYFEMLVQFIEKQKAEAERNK